MKDAEILDDSQQLQATVEQVENIGKFLSEKKLTPPFDAGINEFKRLLKTTVLSKKDRNKAVKEYKERVYNQVNEIKEKISERRAKEGA